MTRWRWLRAGAVVVQLVVLYWPNPASPPSSLPSFDKLVHATVFAAVAFTGTRAGVPLVVLAVALAAHAGLSEVIQAAVLANRQGDGLDVVADLVGTALGLAAAAAWQSAGRARRGPRRAR